ncbi:MAG: type II 3-dehydroquinate dehydratase [Gemmatimonadota bacterium]
MRVTVLNGPNLNLLGTREPEVYGRVSLSAIEALARTEAESLGIELSWAQSNHEGVLIDRIQALPGTAEGLVLNAGALTHTSMAIRDALLAVRIPFVEVHLSNLFAREPSRRDSQFADLAIGLITGFGPTGYLLALRALHDRLSDR